MIYVFGSYRLNTQTYELHCGGDLCRMDTRAFEVLRYLIEHRDHTVSRNELLENLWPDQSVSEGLVTNCIATARRAIGDSGGEQEKIRTLYNAGYRFVAAVEERSPAATWGEGVSVASTPVFRHEEPDLHTMGDASALSSAASSSGPQNVLGEDYRLVTVACGGLKPIEGQDETLGREAVHRFRPFFFARAQELIQQVEGGFWYFGSDGFLAIFGWPTWREDHAQRAVRVGLELQERLRDANLALQSEAPLVASLSMGLHAGPMELENRRDPYATVPLAVSETTQVAIRLRHLAPSGILLTSPATLPLLQKSVEYVEHGSIYLPGHANATPTYRLVGLAAS